LVIFLELSISLVFRNFSVVFACCVCFGVCTVVVCISLSFHLIGTLAPFLAGLGVCAVLVWIIVSGGGGIIYLMWTVF
jgi:hypothetical protein